MEDSVIVQLTDYEVRALAMNPEALQLVIDYHEVQIVEGEAMGFDISFHERRVKILREVILILEGVR